MFQARIMDTASTNPIPLRDPIAHPTYPTLQVRTRKDGVIDRGEHISPQSGNPGNSSSLNNPSRDHLLCFLFGLAALA